MSLPFRTSTYGLIIGGLLLVIQMVSITHKTSSHDNTVTGVIALGFLLTMSIVTGVALLQAKSLRLCLVNFLLLALFAGLLSAAFSNRGNTITQRSMIKHIISLERALQKEGIPFTPFEMVR